MDESVERGEGTKVQFSGNKKTAPRQSAEPSVIFSADHCVRLFFVKSYFLNGKVGAVHLQVQVNPVIAGGGCQVADTILVAAFAAHPFVHLTERLGFVRVEKTANHLGCFGFGIYLLLILNGNFHTRSKVFGERFDIAGIQGAGDGFKTRVGLAKSESRDEQEQKKQISHFNVEFDCLRNVAFILLTQFRINVTEKMSLLVLGQS